MPKVGAHVSAAISLDLSFERAEKIGAEVTQIFITSPRQWATTTHDEAEIENYKKAQEKSQIGPNFIHGPYLINLGTSNSEHLQKSIDSLTYHMQMAQKLGMNGVIFHMGSHKDRQFEDVFEQVVGSLEKILDSSRDARTVYIDKLETNYSSFFPYLILENPVASGGNIGSNFQDLGKILKAVGDSRLKVCLDTQHAFASGYDLKTKLGINDVLEEFEEEIGLEKLIVIHANDSKVEYKSFRDRHENIGDGFIGKEGFENLINHPKLKDKTFVLEVPGFSGGGPDLENVQLLKNLRLN